MSTLRSLLAPGGFLFVGPAEAFLASCSGFVSVNQAMSFAFRKTSAKRIESAMARWLLWLSAAGVVVPMLLAVDYAISRVFPVPALDLRAMALIHGDLNALAFSLAGLLGWTMVRRERESRESGRRMLLQRQEQR